MSLTRDLSNIVGPEWVSSEQDQLAAYAQDNSFVSSEMPECVIRPGNPEEVQATVRWANSNSTPLTPVSSGGPRIRGDTIPARGGVVLDMERMNKIIRIIELFPGSSIEISGHTDSTGSDNINQSISQARAEKVGKFLTDVGEIDSKRIAAIGYGESRPLATNKTAEGRAENRRVEIKIINQ